MPTETDFIIDEFNKEINASDALKYALKEHINQTFSMNIKSLDARETLIEQEVNLLLVHDIEDSRIPFHNSKSLYFEYHNSDLLLTKGLGHNRILSDQVTLTNIVELLNEEKNKRIKLPISKIMKSIV